VEAIVFIAIVLVAAFLVGAAARFAVPGPDPMPVWLTIVIGIAGAFTGALIVFLIGLLFAGGEPAGPAPAGGEELSDEEAVALGVIGLIVMFVVALVGATLLTILYRKLVQGRPITGPAAHRPPLRAKGLRRIVTRKPHRYVEETADPDAGWAPEQLQKLVLLRDAGEIDEAEYQRRKDALVARL